MKKSLPVFLAGMVLSALIFGLGIPALAESSAIGTVEFNTVGLLKDGKQVFYSDEDYLLENGHLVPGSIQFADPSGNATTYLPVRRLAELFDTQISWDGATGSVVLGNPLPTEPPTQTLPEPDTQPTAQTVYITDTGEKYHRAGCRYLKKSQSALNRSDAQRFGYSPCSVCCP